LEKRLYQPKDIAKTCGIKISTLNGYLRDTEMFPPAKVDAENGFRFYDDTTIANLDLFKKLRKKPFVLKIGQVKIVMKKLGARKAEILHKSNMEIFKYLDENKLW
jgi:DNA-binding transcriptional MerR regulator